MRTSTMLALVAAVSASLCGAAISHAALVAADSSSNYSGSFGGQNGGTGFGTWSVVNSDPSVGAAGGGSYVSTSTNGGFAIYENGAQGPGTDTDTVTAVRPFTGALASNQAFSFFDYLNNGSNSSNSGPGGGAGPGSSLGFSLEDSTGTPLFTLAAHGGGGYTLTDATQSAVNVSGLGYNYHSQDTFDFVLNDASTGAYTLTVTGNGVGTAGTVTENGFISTTTGGISQVAIFNTNGGQGSDLQFDNLAITNTPEPTLALVGAVGALGLMRRRRV